MSTAGVPLAAREPSGEGAGPAAGRRRRAQRLRRVMVLVIAFGLLLGGGVFAVVSVLGILDARGPVIERCVASLPDGSSASLAPDQADNAALFAAVATHRGLPARAVTIAIATGIQESKLRNIDYGDRDSLGLFQQRPSQGWGTADQVMDPVYATNAFYDVLVTIAGYEDLPVTDAAQRVQRSAFPDAYGDHEGEARAFASALMGYSPESLTCVLRPASEDAVAGAPAAVEARLARDFVEVSTSRLDDGAVRVDAASLAPGAGPEDAVRLAWAVAQWAVATAGATGAGSVSVADVSWVRADGRDAGWAASSAVVEPGVVVIR